MALRPCDRRTKLGNAIGIVFVLGFVLVICAPILLAFGVIPQLNTLLMVLGGLVLVASLGRFGTGRIESPGGVLLGAAIMAIGILLRYLGGH
jgi:hypothetical protein